MTPIETRVLLAGADDTPASARTYNHGGAAQVERDGVYPMLVARREGTEPLTLPAAR